MFKNLLNMYYIIKLNMHLNDKMPDNIIGLLKNRITTLDCYFGKYKPPLISAILKNNEYYVSMFIHNGASPDFCDHNEISPLMYACQTGNIEIVKILIKHGADVNKRDKNGKTPITYAYEHANIKIIQLLIDNGADLVV